MGIRKLQGVIRKLETFEDRESEGFKIALLYIYDKLKHYGQTNKTVQQFISTVTGYSNEELKQWATDLCIDIDEELNYCIKAAQNLQQSNPKQFEELGKLLYNKLSSLKEKVSLNKFLSDIKVLDNEGIKQFMVMVWVGNPFKHKNIA